MLTIVQLTLVSFIVWFIIKEIGRLWKNELVDCIVIGLGFIPISSGIAAIIILFKNG